MRKLLRCGGGSTPWAPRLLQLRREVTTAAFMCLQLTRHMARQHVPCAGHGLPQHTATTAGSHPPPTLCCPLCAQSSPHVVRQARRNSLIAAAGKPSMNPLSRKGICRLRVASV